MKFIDFFAGIGGFREGLERNDFEPVGWCEFDKFKQQAYKTVHDAEGEWFKDDIKSVQPGELPDADIYTGGFPCQSFSIAGNRGGFEDTRGTLFFEIARLAKERQPKYLLLENVKGLLSHDGGRTFGTILQTLWDIGYNVEWQVLNSKDFGVPQNRERIFIIGHLRGEPRPKVFPIQRQIKGNIKYAHFDRTQTYRVLDTDGISSCCTTCSTGGRQVQKLITENGFRQITPLEYFRLQGFPDEWYYKCREAGISDTQMYRAAGDAVTVNVVQEIGRRLKNEGKNLSRMWSSYQRRSLW